MKIQSRPIISKLKSFIILAATALLAALPATSRPVDAGHAVVELIAERATTVPGDELKAALSLQLDYGWHVYWKNAGDSGLPPMITWEETSGTNIGEFSWPAPNEQPLEGLMNYGYEGHLVLPFDISVPDEFSGREITLRGFAEWLICLDICIPESAELVLTIPVGGTPEVNSNSSDLIAKSIAETPVDLVGQASLEIDNGMWTLSVQSEGLAATASRAGAQTRFFPYDHQIEHAAQQPVSIGPRGLSVGLTPNPNLAENSGLSGVLVTRIANEQPRAWVINAEPGPALEGTTGQSSSPSIQGADSFAGGNLVIWLGAALLGGIVLNLMPCVLPVLTIKAMGFVQTAAAGHSGALRLHGLAYLAGVLVCFGLIGSVLAGLLAAGQQTGLGFQLQYPPIVVALALLMFVIGLNMAGFFDFGSSLIGFGHSIAAQSGTAGAFFTGVLAAVVGAPCVGPFLGAALGAVVSQPAPIIVLVFLVMGFGMALPFLVLSFAPEAHRFLPKPGQWMERLRQFFAFPLF